MAKSVNLTVKVDDTQFKQFIRNFNAFSAQIKGLNAQFAQINTTIQKTTQSSNALLGVMRSLWSMTKSLLGTVSSITGHFLKWGTIIGGVTTLLGFGGGLFGIDRLAAAILQKRRMVLGLGSDYGRTQARMIFGQSFLDSPQDVLQNVRMGMGGDPERMRTLAAMGIPFGTKMAPEEVLDKILEKMPGILKQGGPGTELMTAQAYGLDKFFSPQDIMRLSSEKGAKEMRDQLAKARAAEKDLTLSEKAQKAWSDLELQFQKAKTAIQNVFGERLADLAPTLNDLSDSFVRMVRVLMNTPIIERLLKQFNKWLQELADYLQSDDLEKDLKAMSDKIEEWIPWFVELKDQIVDFGHKMADVIEVLSKVINFFRGLNPSQQDVLQRLQERNNPPGMRPSDQFRVAPPGQAPSNIVTPPAAPAAPQAPPAPVTVPPVPSINQPQKRGDVGGAGGTVNQFAAFGAGGGNQFASFMGGGIQGGSQYNLAGGGTAISAIRGGDTSIMASRTGDRMTSWSEAANRATPGADMRGGAINMENRSSWAQLNFPGGSKGPLDADNWQSSRTASLTIRNVPGANVYAHSNVMAG